MSLSSSPARYPWRWAGCFTGAASSPLARALFDIDGVDGVFYGSDFISVTKSDAADWQALKPAVLGTIMEHFTSGAPLLEEACAFDLLVYADADAKVPAAWEESDPKYIASSTEVRLRSFTTSIHKVLPSVSYKAGGATA